MVWVAVHEEADAGGEFGGDGFFEHFLGESDIGASAEVGDDDVLVIPLGQERG